MDIDLNQVGDGADDNGNTNMINLLLDQDNGEDTGDSTNMNDATIVINSDDKSTNGNYNNIDMYADQDIGSNMNDLDVTINQNQSGSSS